MGRPRIQTLPILPLPLGSVLLPGVTLHIPVIYRPDVPPLLSSVITKAKSPKATTISIGCVPLNSHLLNSHGQNLIEGGEERHQRPNDIHPSEARKEDLFRYGTVAKISGVQGRRSDDLVLIVEGIRRFKINKLTQRRPFFEAEVTYIEDENVDLDDPDVQSLFDQLKRISVEIIALTRLSTFIPQIAMSRKTRQLPLFSGRLEMFISGKEIEDAGVLADFMTNAAGAKFEDKLRVLAILDVKDRLEQVVDLLSGVLEGLKKNIKISSVTSTIIPSDGLDIRNIGRSNRNPLMWRAINSIGSWTGQSSPPGLPPQGVGSNAGDEEIDEIAELKNKLDEARLTPEGQKVADRELKRLRKMSPAQAEYGVCKTYLETLSEIPWSVSTEDQLGGDTLKRARKQLDDDHYGLEKIKKRLLEYLAVLRLKQAVNADIEAQIARATEQSSTESDEEDSSSKRHDSDDSHIQILKSKRKVDKSPILLLVGPPGTGKTSLAKSVATALGRKFHRISLGGVRDEAEVRGHRRTYVAAMPGLIVGGLKKVGVNNPVFLLDEIDKVGGSNYHGDPSAAMLEVLDPEQNCTFTDHYLDVPIDLSKVLFIATANSLDTIPAPLLDRMETIPLSGYTTLEKRHIALQHLIPKQINTNGLSDDQVIFTDDVVDTIITSYTREFGVRNLEREIGSVCRYKAVEYADAKDTLQHEMFKPLVSLSDLENILGITRFEEEIAETDSVPGIVTGLVAYSFGGQGSILFIEVADMPGTGKVQLTGKLGDVLKESVEVALTWVKAHSYDLGLTHDATEDIMRNRSVHVHCPSGAIPKDGPSAGLAHTMALISLFSGKAVPPQIAMTGEVSLRGRVMPVGGIKEKLIGAMRAGVKTVLLPVANRKDAMDLPLEIKTGLEIVYVAHIWEAIRRVWPDARWPGERPLAGVESRL